jgi:exodeoxyribonuclease V alpha subunit
MSKTRTATTVEGNIEHITYYNSNNHFTIAKLREHRSNSLVSVLGYFPNPVVGETLKISGKWVTHPKYGQQLRMDAYETILPESRTAIQKYLASGIIAGIGQTLASRLVAKFGDSTFDVIDNSPVKLMDVSGIGPEKALRITEAWHAHHAVQQLSNRLQENGIKPEYAAKLYRVYGPEALQTLETEPFRLVQDIPKIGFYIADTFVNNSGGAVDEPARAQACILHLLQQASDEGHVFVPENRLIETGNNQFNIDEHLAIDAIASLAHVQQIVVENTNEGCLEGRGIYLKELHRAEHGTCKKLEALLSLPVSQPSIDTEHLTREIQLRVAIKLSTEQITILKGILSHRVAIITGGPGTGKTTLLRSIAAVFDATGKKITLAAPTGRAARRLAEVTRKPAATIHKLLRFNPATREFEKNQDHPIEAEAILIDEASMIDILLMHHLLKAVPVTTRLILVGDLFQLPSVGPGNVLSDLIQSEKVKTFKLSKIFRQAQESQIIINAHKVRQGNFSLLRDVETGDSCSDFLFIEENQPDNVITTILDLYCNKIPLRFGFDAVREIQVLIPMHKGPVGTLNLNALIQKEINPMPEAVHVYGNHFRPGDKVMHLKNNYQKEIFNGEIGLIDTINQSESNIVVDYDGRRVSYAFSELDELTLAYAISIHKSQGSEYPAVIIPLMTHHFALLQRNLLYTAITRGKKLVVIIGSKKAVQLALNNDKQRLRMSGLSHRLMAASHRT